MAHGILHQFKAALERRQARKDQNDGKFNKSKLDYNTSDAKTEFDFPELSETDMETLKEKIRADIRVGKRKDFILVLFVFGLLTILFLFFTL